MSTWPNFFIVGAVKSGTTSLYAHLREHPQVFMPEVKEPHFFAKCDSSPEMSNFAYVEEQSEYLRLYEGAAGFSAIGDASPSYLWDKEAPGRIHQACPQARIIILLRDPVARAYAHYWLDRFSGIEGLPFAEALAREQARAEKGLWQSRLYVECGLYHDQVRRYLDTFGRKQVLVLLFDELIVHPRRLFEKLACHLGVDPQPFEHMELAVAHNEYKVPRHRMAYRLATSRFGRRLRQGLLPASVNRRLATSSLLFDKKKPPIDQTARQYLQEIFAPELSRLESLLQRGLPELRKSWT